jgi:hypothetical protein
MENIAVGKLGTAHRRASLDNYLAKNCLWINTILWKRNKNELRRWPSPHGLVSLTVSLAFPLTN